VVGVPAPDDFFDPEQLFDHMGGVGGGFEPSVQVAGPLHRKFLHPEAPAEGPHQNLQLEKVAGGPAVPEELSGGRSPVDLEAALGIRDLQRQATPTSRRPSRILSKTGRASA